MLNPPDVWTSHVRWNSSTGWHILLCALSGTSCLHFRPAGEDTVRDVTFRAGQAVLVPAGLARQLDVGPGDLVVPIGLREQEVSRPSADPELFHVGSTWVPWLLHHFVSARSPLRSRGQTARDLLRRVAADRADGGPVPVGPVVQVAPAVSAVAESLYEDPGDRRTADDWAAWGGVSVRTLYRGFRASFGVSFADWRRECRLSAAEEYLRAGYGVSWVADRVGFLGVSGFVRAFRDSRGVPPGIWAHERGRAAEQQESTGDRVRIARERSMLVDALPGAFRTADTPAIPGSTTGMRADMGDLLLWVHAGTARVDIGGRRRTEIPLRTGDAVWIPAGVVHDVVVDHGSVVMPLSFGPGEVPAAARTVRTTKIPPSGRDDMLRHTIANLTAIRPENYDRLSALDIFDDSIRHQQEMAVDMPPTGDARTIASALLRNLRDDRALDDWATELGTEAKTLDRAFREQTGRSFVSWRSAVRLRAAHDLMVAGTSPSAAARRVGYTYLSGFSRDFSRHYGVTPREFVGT